MDQRADKGDVNGTRIPLLGVLACAIGVLQMLTVLAAESLYTIGGHYRPLGVSIGGFAGSYGLALDLLALIVAIFGIVFGGSNRRLGIIAIALVVLSFAL